MTIVAYARISDFDPNPDAQLDALKYHGYDKLFVDRTSGFERPELARALAALKAGDILLFSRLDHLARSNIHLGQIAEACRFKRAHLKGLSQPIDTTTSRATFAVLSAMAEFESDRISERTRIGKKAAAAGTNKGGRAFGYRLKRALTPREPEAQARSGIAHAIHRSETGT